MIGDEPGEIAVERFPEAVNRAQGNAALDLVGKVGADMLRRHIPGADAAEGHEPVDHVPVPDKGLFGSAGDMLCIDERFQHIIRFQGEGADVGDVELVEMLLDLVDSFVEHVGKHPGFQGFFHLVHE